MELPANSREQVRVVLCPPAALVDLGSALRRGVVGRFHFGNESTLPCVLPWVSEAAEVALVIEPSLASRQICLCEAWIGILDA